MESLSRRGVSSSREVAAKRQRILFFTLVGVIVLAMGLTQIWSTGSTTQHPVTVGQTHDLGSH